MTSSAWPTVEPLAAERLVLEPLRVEHAVEMAPVLVDAALYTFIGAAPPTESELADRYARQATGRSPDGGQGWLNWIVRELSNGRLVGSVQATLTLEGCVPMAELAWVIATSAQGNGYAGEASEAVTAWLRSRGISRFVAHIHPDHAASAGVARRLGLRPTDVRQDGERRWTNDARPYELS